MKGLVNMRQLRQFPFLFLFSGLTCRTSINSTQTPKAHHGGGTSRGGEEEEDLQEVHLPRRRPRPAPGHEQWATDGVVPVQNQEEVHPRPQEEAHGLDQEVEEEEEGMSPQREARLRQDPPQGHDHRARDDRLRRRRVQRKDLQSGRDQARDDRPLLGRVLHHLQAG